LDEWPSVINFFRVPLLCEEFDGDRDGDDSSGFSFLDFTFLIFFNSLLEKFFLPSTTVTSTGLTHGNISSTKVKNNIIFQIFNVINFYLKKENCLSHVFN